MDQKIDYAALMDEAKRKNGLDTDYKLAKALGFKRPSSIYPIRSGKDGLSAAKLTRLLQLAGKLGLFWALGALLFLAPVDVSQAKSRPDLTANMDYAQQRNRAGRWVPAVAQRRAPALTSTLATS